jgi:hypothetical protein
MHNPGRLTPYVITFLLGTTLAGGVSAVAASTSTGAKVCETAKHLVVGAVHGKCPSGTTTKTLGARGPRGLRGKTGAAVVPVTYAARLVPTGNIPTSSSEYLETTTVPAGRYLVNFTASAASVVNGSGFGGTFSCIYGNDTFDNKAGAGAADITYGGTGELSGTQVVTLSKPAPITLNCDASGLGTLQPAEPDELFVVPIGAFK